MDRIPNFSNWYIYTDFVKESSTGEDSLTIVSLPCNYEYLATSPSFFLSAGEYRCSYLVSALQGGLTIGAVDVKTGKWITNNCHEGKTDGSFGMDLLLKTNIMLVVAACNHGEKLKAVFELTQFDLKMISSGPIYYCKKIYNEISAFRERFQTNVKPVYFLNKVIFLFSIGKTVRRFKKSFPFFPFPRGMYVTDFADAGYAIRSIVKSRINGTEVILTANVGDDSISVYSVADGCLSKKRNSIHFSQFSAPMYLASLNMTDYAVGYLVCFFGFDIQGNYSNKTALAFLNEAEIPFKNRENIDINSLNLILERKGACGYRGVKVLQDADLNFVIACIDRDKGLFHLLRGKPDEDSLSYTEDVLELGSDTEPIGVNAIADADDPLSSTYYLTSRSQEQLLVVGYDTQGRISVLQRYELGDRSRSSVAVGCFRRPGEKEVAVALWGGDPKELNSFGEGSFIVASLDENGLVKNHISHRAGVHPTDIAAGDFDGDGLDEIVVLNYGVGLGPTDRKHPGSIQFFKCIDSQFYCIKEIGLAHPRIACVADIDGDGIDEVVVSLFFEKKLIVLKWL